MNACVVLTLWLAAQAGGESPGADPDTSGDADEQPAAPDDDDEPDSAAAWADEFDDFATEDELDDLDLDAAEIVDEGAEAEDAPGQFTTTIVGNAAQRRRLAGSAHQVSEEQLERGEHDDVHRILKQVPGVYLRDEDGFGLRPNIGLRGANSDRSAKVTLMEDGVLLGPAPYAAPAAYYFPLVTRMTRVEVFKGPASIKYGPQTVGGALNFRTRGVPYDGHRAGLDLAGGAYRAGKAHGHYGYGHDWFGVMVEGVHLTHGGFKQLDGGGDTGFQRTDVMAKARLNTPLDETFVHRLDVKLGYGHERSNETYLGLTDADFRLNPNRRYVSSSQDQMQWDRTQLEARYTFSWADVLDVQTVLYRHDFHRAWHKLNRFRGGPTMNQIFRDPDGGQTGLYRQILTGDADSTLPSHALLVGTNERTYVSQGAQMTSNLRFRLWQVEQEIEVGMRLHQDQIDRLHDESPYNMVRRTLVPEGGPREVVVQNHGDAFSGAAYIHDSISWGGLLLTPGFRFELIRTGFDDYLDDSRQNALRFAWLPGMGASYTLFDMFTVFGGVHKGFSPVSPGQDPSVQPEDSLNFESGARFFRKGLDVELIGFFNRYANITGECTFSSGCDPDDLTTQFNGGEAWVYGLEAHAGWVQPLPWGMRVGGQVAYTLTLSQFRGEFVSGFDQFGRVEVGDQLPYVPIHQGGAQFYVGGRLWEASLDASYVGAMRDVAGQGELVPIESTDAQYVIDAGASFLLTDDVKLYFRADNILNQRAIASRRPFGARPNKPMSFMGGIKIDFRR